MKEMFSCADANRGGAGLYIAVILETGNERCRIYRVYRGVYPDDVSRYLTRYQPEGTIRGEYENGKDPMNC